MTAKIISCINQKGGSGKSTVAMTLAPSFGERGYKVLVIDGDMQGTAMQWYSSVPEGEKFAAVVVNLSHAGEKIGAAMQAHRSEYDIIIIDTPGSLRDKLPTAALVQSDLALVPVLPAASDLWATAQVQELVGQAQGMNPSLKVLLVVNQMMRTNLAEQSVAVLRSGEHPVAKAMLGTRNAYRMAAALGSSVKHGDDPKAIEESEELADEVLAVLDLPKKKKKPAAVATAAKA